MDNLKLKLSQHHLSVINLATVIFNKPPVKLKIKEFVDEIEYDIEESLENSRKIWIKDLINQVIEMNEIPETVKQDLPLVIRQLSNRLFAWLKYIFTKLEDTADSDTYPGIFDYVDHLKWTSIGLIDEIETFKSVYHSDPGSKSINLDLLFRESCEFCLYDIITEIWSNYNEDDKVHLAYRLQKTAKAEKKNHLNLLNYWQYELSKDLPLDYKLIGLYRIYDPYNQLKNNFTMFNQVIAAGHENSVRFFYKKLDQREKKDILLPTVKWLLENKLLKYNFSQNYHDNNFVWIFIYFWQELTEAMRLTCLKFYKITILNILFYNWSSSSFLSTLSIGWRFFNPIDYRDLCRNVVKLVADEYDEIGTIKYTNLLIIGEIWKKSPEKLKESFLNIIINSPIGKLAKYEQICLVASVVHDDKEISSIHDNVISYFEENHSTFLVNEKYDILDLFVEHICQTELEKSTIKNRISQNCYSIFKYFLVYKSVQSSERYLNWKYSNNNHQKIVFKNDFKKNIDFLLTILDICLNEDAEDEQLATKLHLVFKWFEISKRDIVNLKNRLLFSPDLKVKLENIPAKNVNELWRICDSFIWKQQSIEKPSANRRLSLNLC